MASTPGFASTILNGSQVLSATADASSTAPTHTVTLVTAGASGSKIDEIRLVGTGTTVTGLINIFAFDGSTYWIIDSVVVPVVTPSTTVANWVWSKSYPNLILASGWSLRVTGTATNQLVCASAFGASL
jgi:hypothetical protein